VADKIKQLAKRASWRELSEAHRAKIKASQIINRLNSAALGEVEMTPSQLRAGLGLLAKVLPDLSASEVTKVSETINPVEALEKLKTVLGEEAYNLLKAQYTPNKSLNEPVH
jgi:hypothetical protein